MAKFFNTAGPIKPEDHYFLPNRLQKAGISSLIDEKKYFILHAPRQTGKTTAIFELVKSLNQVGKFKAIYINVEAAQAARHDVLQAMATILSIFRDIAETDSPGDKKLLDFLEQERKKDVVSGNSLQAFLRFWSIHSKQPLVLFIDEIDALVGDTLISVLRQLRTGYSNRPTQFPQSVCLMGVRDVRDYRIWSDKDQNMILGGSAFNIKSKSLSLLDFSREEVAALYKQHTNETGQVFTPEAVEYAFFLSQGQPWLVNALAYEVCFEDVKNWSVPITKEVLERAKETLIMRRDTHLDVLIDRLREPRVCSVIGPILLGSEMPKQVQNDDIQYCKDLGLISRTDSNWIIANPIYQEVIPRELTWSTQGSLTLKQTAYLSSSGLLDMHKLLDMFTAFFREHSEVWIQNTQYHEAGPHLLLMAYLQRIINGGGSIHREYALGRKRVDLLVGWKTQRIVIELKIYHDKNTFPQGIEQTADYMDIANATEGHLLIFDRSVNKSWDEKIYTREEKFAGKVITIWGM